MHYPHTDESGQRAYHKLVDFLTGHGWMGGDKAYLYPGFKDWTEAREQQLGLTIPSVRSFRPSSSKLDQLKLKIFLGRWQVDKKNRAFAKKADEARN